MDVALNTKFFEKLFFLQLQMMSLNATPLHMSHDQPCLLPHYAGEKLTSKF
jgi:hypothetical protein